MHVHVVMLANKTRRLSKQTFQTFPYREFESRIEIIEENWLNFEGRQKQQDKKQTMVSKFLLKKNRSFFDHISTCWSSSCNSNAKKAPKKWQLSVNLLEAPELSAKWRFFALLSAIGIAGVEAPASR